MGAFYFEVKCDIHGRQETGSTLKSVTVGRPKNKKDRFTSGCPFCKQEKAAKEKAS